MNKNEIIEAIQQTIVPNGKKGITAESLANLLMEMVNATPEGESGGSGSITFFCGLASDNIHEATGMIIADLTPEEREHNVKMFETFKTAQVKMPISGDLSRLYRQLIETEEGIDATGLSYICTSMMAVYMPAAFQGVDGGPQLDSDSIELIGGGLAAIFLPDGSALYDL